MMQIKSGPPSTSWQKDQIDFGRAPQPVKDNKDNVKEF
jgi:hypothetical protein